jgi:hypothetical protein
MSYKSCRKDAAMAEVEGKGTKDPVGNCVGLEWK